jgi:glucosamine kinase
MDLYVGIDGGGTRTTAVATGPNGRVISRVEGEAGIVRVLEPAAGASTLAGLTRRAASAAGAAEAPVAALCCALAGAGREPERVALEAALRATGVAERIRVTTDAEGAMADAFGTGAGILLIAGTGSIAWGRDAAGRTARAGGWGLQLGDEGSGYAIGMAALQAVVRAHDGRAPDTALAADVLERTGVGAVEGLIAWTAAAAKGDVGALAPGVCAAAAAGDAPARAILDQAAAALFDHVRALHDRLGPWEAPPTLACSGALVAPGGPLRARLCALAGRELPRLTILDRPIDAASGAAAIARSL